MYIQPTICVGGDGSCPEAIRTGTGTPQTWYPRDNGDGTLSYTTVDGRCLDSNWTSTPWTPGTAGNAYALPCNGGDYQKWQVAWMGAPNAGFRLTDYATGLVLDSNAYGYVYMMYDNGGNNQRWH
jgi:serine/threonine-protein kinase